MVTGGGESARIRNFVAIELPAPVKEALSLVRDQLREDGIRARWVREPNFHVSLRFLGDLSADERDRIESGLEEVCAKISSFSILVRGCGGFPDMQSPRVVWAGVSGDLDSLTALGSAVEAAAREAGLAPNQKAFRPHITLGRIRYARTAANVERALLKHAGYSGGAFPVERVSLFASELRPGGARYTRLRSFALTLTG